MGKNNPANLPKFFYCSNEIADEYGEYVRHNHLPRFTAKYTPDDPLSHFEIVEETDDMMVFYKGDAMKVAGLMRRLGDWWVAYNRFLDENFDE